MNVPYHLPPLDSAPDARAGGHVPVMPRDVQWGRPIFRAPALPTWPPLVGGLPFAGGWLFTPLHRQTRR